MRAHELNENGTIVNTVVVEQLAEGQIDADFVGGGIGDRIVNGHLFPREPAIVAAPSFAVQKVQYLDMVRALREKALIRLNGYGNTLMLAEPPDRAEEKAACLYLIEALLDITTIPPVAEAITLPELTAAVKAEYARLVAYANAASLDLVKTFRQVDM